MAKFKLGAALGERLRSLRAFRENARRNIDNRSPEIAASHSMAIELRYHMRVQIERWLEKQEGKESEAVASALLACATDLLEAGLQLASKHPNERTVTLSRFSQTFVEHAIQSELLTDPRELARKHAEGELERQYRKINPSLVKPDGTPWQ